MWRCTVREIKFRAWDEETDTMYYSDNCWENNEATFVCENDGSLKCYVPELIHATHEEPEHIVGRELTHIMQFTGLKDKNGKEIYEGDILAPNNREVLWYDEGEGPIGVGFYSQCHADGYSDSFWTFGITQADASEVIGDIHENPELREKKA
jgi:hypothetical protein